MLLGDMMRLNAMKFPDKTALVFKDTRLSYSELNSRANRLANALLGIGVSKGDRVAVLADNCSQYMEAYFATSKVGMIIVPINNSLDAEGITYIVNDSGANTIIFGENYLDTVNSLRPGFKSVKNYIVIGQAPGAESYEKLVSSYPPDELEVEVDEDDTAWLLYTSGTTGPPKGVMLDHKSQIVDSANTILTCFPINRSDIHLVILPLFHIGSLWHMRCHFYMGNTIILMDARDPKAVLETIEREKVTTMCFVPPMIVPIANHPDVDKYDVSSMRIMIYSGAPLPEGLERRLHEIFGDIIIQVFALTEGGPAIIMPPLMEGPWEKVKRLGSCGKDVINVEVRLVNEEGKECAPGEIGEILARGDNIMKGYWNMPEATAKTLEGGYLHTGDLATRDEEGYYYITGRKKDVISSGGKPVYSPEIENVMSLHPAISEVAVIGVPDKELGEAVKAMVVLRAGKKATEKEIIGWCQGKLDDYKVPRSVRIVDRLPKTPSGKVLKNILRERYSQR
ncbi:MAG: long-chain-fatty-acid--CoA ligase [Dehalococcoidia bacterium]|nr:long-chain-fatty-acid--CoA ligase [Dehalococcoidia bacterium]